MKNIFTIVFTLLASCALYANVNITFRVDMTNQTLGPNGVHLAGGFGIAGYPQWDPSGITMTDGDLDNIYEVLLSLPESSYFEYKFINGNAWGSDEGVPGACNCNGNRCVTSGTVDQTLAVRCFGECSFCAGNPQFFDVTFQVDMQSATVSPNGVHLAGNFGFNPAPNTYPMWNPAGIVMTDADLNQVYEVTLQLAEGYYFEYKFINGNAWGEEEDVPGTCSSYGNRYLTVPVSDLVMDGVCFAECGDCIVPGCTTSLANNYNPLATIDDGSCLFNVDFVVDMQNFNGSVSAVFVVGSWSGFSTTANPMTDVDLNGVWTATLPFSAGNYEYKFYVTDGSTFEFFVDGEPCTMNTGGGNNRSFTMNASSFALPLYCWESCYSCMLINVTFSVNMVGQTVSPEGVHLAGSFNGWFPTLMEDNGNNIWSMTMSMQSGNNYEFKFVNGDFLDDDSEIIAGGCTTGALGNRYFTAPLVDFTHPTYCYAQCAECPLDVSITFRVDMFNETVSPQGVHLTGSFNGWNPAIEAMSFIGYGIYEVTLVLSPYTYHEYKFINGDAFGMDENLPSDCTNNFNRSINTGFSDSLLPVVCFAECGACGGCTNPFYTNYNPFSGFDNGTCADLIVFGCTYPDATNHNPAANADDGSCVYEPVIDNCPADLDGNGVVNVSDLLVFMGSFGTFCQ